MSLNLNTLGADDPLSGQPLSAMNDVTRAYRQILSSIEGPQPSIDPAAAVIYTQFEAQIGELRQRIYNTENIIAKYNTADAYLGELRRITIELREHAVAASNSAALDDASLQALQTSTDRLVESYNRIVQDAQYNGAALFDGGERAVASIPQLSQLDLTTTEKIDQSLGNLEVAAAGLDRTRVDLGSHIKNDLLATKNSLQIELENLNGAQSGLMTDLATALTEFIRALRRAQIQTTLQAHAKMNRVALYDLLRPPE